MSDYKKYDISYSWTQSYQGWTVPQTANTNEEMIRIEAVDNIVNAMKSYPDAEEILTKILFSK